MLNEIVYLYGSDNEYMVVDSHVNDEGDSVFTLRDLNAIDEYMTVYEWEIADSTSW